MKTVAIIVDGVEYYVRAEDGIEYEIVREHFIKMLEEIRGTEAYRMLRIVAEERMRVKEVCGKYSVNIYVDYGLRVFN